MARISTYQRDTVVTKNDKVIGTDSSGSITKNFKLEDIAGFFSNTNAIGIATQFNFKFVSSNRGIQTISFDPLAPGNTFNNVTSFVLSKFDAENNNVSEYLKLYEKKEIIIVRLDDYSNFGLFSIAAITDHPNLPDYLTATVSNIKNQGSFIENKYYGLAIYTRGDKHKEFSFTTNTFEPSPEIINGSTMRYFDFTHNLDKFPSITASEVGSPDQVAQIPVKHLNKNTVRVYFNGLTNGKIYAN